MKTNRLLLFLQILAIPMTGFAASPDSLQHTPTHRARTSVQYLADTTIVHVLPDSASGEVIADTNLNAYGIQVKPAEASHASVTIVRTVRSEYQPGTVSSTQINPDTLGRWNAPLRLYLYPGQYSLVAEKEGYRASLRNLFAGESMKRNVAVDVEILSFEYLEAKQAQWKTTKFISAGVCVLAGAVALYWNRNIGNLESDYNNATSPDLARDLHSQINRRQDLYTVFSGIALATLGTTLLSWIIELTYHY